MFLVLNRGLLDIIINDCPFEVLFFQVNPESLIPKPVLLSEQVMMQYYPEGAGRHILTYMSYTGCLKSIF